MATKRSDFLKSFKNFRSPSPSTPAPSPTAPATTAPSKKANEINDKHSPPGQQSSSPPNKPSSPSPLPPSSPSPLPGLHISAGDLAEGLLFAASEIANKDLFDLTIEGARDLLHTISKAYACAFPDRLSDDLSQIVQALKSGRWAPSASDLIASGLTPSALAFMPACEVVVKLPTGGSITMLPQNLWTLQHSIPLTPEDHEVMVEKVGLIFDALPGSTVKAWSTPVGVVDPPGGM